VSLYKPNIIKSESTEEAEAEKEMVKINSYNESEGAAEETDSTNLKTS
jgi:hypothetical protein